MLSFTRSFSLFLVGVSLLLPAVSQASTVDLALSANSIRFSKDILVEGDTVRVYAKIKNVGDVDSVAQVFFYQGDYLIGRSQAISVLADGGSDDVFVDFKLPAGSFNVRAVIQGSDPADSNSANDVAVTPLYKVVPDTDHDTIIDADDNCPERDNLDQADMDDDGEGDVCDTDTDGDGVPNSSDSYPKDASKSKDAMVIPAPQPTPVKPVVVPVVQPAPVVNVTPTVVVQPAPDATTTAVPAEQQAAEPVTEVKGETVEAGQELALDLSGLGLGGTVTSPAASFEYQQIAWKTYKFTALPPIGGGTYTYDWDFGDGAASVQPVIEHVFPAAGNYTVTLVTVDEDGVVATDTENLTVSFFNFGNPLLLVTVGVLVLIMLGLSFFILKLRRGETL